jgi:hypothetical protein
MLSLGVGPFVPRQLASAFVHCSIGMLSSFQAPITTCISTLLLLLLLVFDTCYLGACDDDFSVVCYMDGRTAKDVG